MDQQYTELTVDDKNPAINCPAQAKVLVRNVGRRARELPGAPQ